jgi:endonuclease/exonuclease/phosphatase family metal-dependent hydrolase
MNIWTFAEQPDARIALLRRGIKELSPDLLAFQEAGENGERHQVAEILGDSGYHILHQFEVSERRGDNGNCIASRWPFEQVECLDLRLDGTRQEYPLTALCVRVQIPPPVGPTLFVCNKPSWQLDREYERELQAVAVAEMIARHRDSDEFPTILAGDFDATPDSASVRFFRGRQSLAGRSVHYRDAWTTAGDGSPGHTWTARNPFAGDLVDRLIGERHHGRRIDYIMLASMHDHPRPRTRFSDCRVVLDRPVDGVWPSDHFGVYAEIDFSEYPLRTAPDAE